MELRFPYVRGICTLKILLRKFKQIKPQRGRPWDNGYAERLIRTLKEEEVYLNEYDDIIDARARIDQFILQVYNQKRPHSALGYLTPIEFEQKLLV